MSSWAAGRKPIFYQRFMQQDDNKNKYFTEVLISSEGTLPSSKALPQGTLPRSAKNDLCLCTSCSSLDPPLAGQSHPLFALLTSLPNCGSLLFGCRRLCWCLISVNLSLWKYDFPHRTRWLWALCVVPCLQGRTALVLMGACLYSYQAVHLVFFSSPQRQMSSSAKHKSPAPRGCFPVWFQTAKLTESRGAFGLSAQCPSHPNQERSWTWQKEKGMLWALQGWVWL